MKRYIKASSDNLLTECVVRDIITALDSGRKVYIEDGSINDRIIGYELTEPSTVGNLPYDNAIFKVTGATDYFGTKVNLYDFREVDTEEFRGDLFVKVRY